MLTISWERGQQEMLKLGVALTKIWHYCSKFRVSSKRNSNIQVFLKEKRCKTNRQRKEKMRQKWEFFKNIKMFIFSLLTKRTVKRSEQPSLTENPIWQSINFNKKIEYFLLWSRHILYKKTKYAPAVTNSKAVLVPSLQKIWPWTLRIHEFSRETANPHEVN